MKKTLLLIVLFTSALIYSQPSISWQKTFGGSSSEEAYSIVQTTDGGYITVGMTKSKDGDISVNKGSNDLWVVKMNSTGEMEWQKTYGGNGDDQGIKIEQTTDGGYIIAGRTNTNNYGDFHTNGDYDFWILKLDGAGDLIWQKTFGGQGQDDAMDIHQTSDGGYIVAGYAGANGDDVSGFQGIWDVWVIKLSAEGSAIWKKCYGGKGNDQATCINQTKDGGYIVCARASSNDGDVSGNHGNEDWWVIKLDDSGSLQWQKCYGGDKYDSPFCVQQTPDGGYIIAGDTMSNNTGDVSGFHGWSDCRIIKTDSSGKIAWSKCIGGTENDRMYFNSPLTQDITGSYILSGYTTSNNGDVSGNHGFTDCWIVKISRAAIDWQKCLGGSSADFAYNIQCTSDGGYIITGSSSSNDGDVTGNHGSSDFWVVKLGEALGTNDSILENNFLLYPNPAKNLIQVTIQNSNENIKNINIYDVLGKTIKSISNLSDNQTSVDISNLAKGIYMVEITSENNLKLIRKLVVQ